MPSYVYSTKDGRRTEVTCPMGMAPKWVMVDGVRATRDLAAEHAGPQRACDTWPLESDALGVHPTQIPQAMAEAQRLGCTSITFTPDGRCVLPDRSTRKRYLAAKGFFDKDAGYGD